ncbi:MAG: 4Fe-4S dicluster domain-containing protein [Chthonomonadales bacterium]|nr:4Fe-4S dicluster domain-containing protein [Chthonomonadales bacterium]
MAERQDERGPRALGEVPASESSDVPDGGAAQAGLPAVDRRSFLTLMGLTIAAGTLSGCRAPRKKIIPYLHQPPEATPGVARWYATTCHGCSASCGALAKVMDGRPIKLEGNPDHAMSKGGLCAAGQGSIVGLYDPYRQRGPTESGASVTWERVDSEIGQHLADARRQQRKVVVLTSSVSGPSTRALISEFLAGFPHGRHVVHDAISYDAMREAHRRVYGQPLVPGYRFDRAEVIVSFGADFLGTWLSPVEFAKQYSAGRNLAHPDSAMSRHYHVESRMSLTGSNADIRYGVAPSEQGAYVAAVAAAIGREGGHAGPATGALAAAATPSLSPEAARRVETMAAALRAARGRSLVVSDSDDVSVQVAVLALNEALGNTGRTVDLARPSLQKQGSDAEMSLLVDEMRRGEVGVLIVHACNPAYTFARAGEFAEALGKVACAVSMATVPDETARAATWHCPSHHSMEAWGDAEPHAGSYSLFQPTIRPLYRTRAFEDNLLKWQGKGERFHSYLRRHWQTRLFPRQREFATFDAFWDGMLQRGYLELAASPPPPAPRLRAEAAAALREIAGRPMAASGLELEVYEPVALRDGSDANNPWLQELPDPLTKITWDNYAAISPALAREKGIEDGQWVTVRGSAGSARAPSVVLPAHIQPGQHPRTVSIALGYGRKQAGPVGSGVGVNAYPLVAMQGPRRSRRGIAIEIAATDGPDGRVHPFARTQIHDTMDERPLVRQATYAEFRKGLHPESFSEEEKRADLWDRHEYPEYQWSMAIDLTRCVGCSACVTACDIENNVPVVGPKEVARQREMHWMRIDRYYTGGNDDPGVLYEPLMCQHCDNASCETVCPVLATEHDNQGLNVQVYNRCVGTRYCANNCPYKVRRFNWFNNIKNDPTRSLALNPDVTVRSRGVMEKCSLCIQRIQAARIKARTEGRLVRDGEVKTACEQSCPADAIVFGNLKDPNSRVSRQGATERSFRLLEELNRRPAVCYMAKVRNTEDEA